MTYLPVATKQVIQQLELNWKQPQIIYYQDSNVVNIQQLELFNSGDHHESRLAVSRDLSFCDIWCSAHVIVLRNPSEMVENNYCFQQSLTPLHFIAEEREKQM